MSKEQGPSNLAQANGESSGSEMERMVAGLVKKAMEAERAKSMASGGASQTGGHSVTGRRISSIHSPTCGMTGLGSLLLACMLVCFVAWPHRGKILTAVPFSSLYVP